MIETYKYEKRYWYPHMKPHDVEIWERFIDRNPEAYDNCQYDFWVGSLPSFDIVVNPESGGDQEGNYRKKIDVVARKDGKIDIIEVKPDATASAVGQVKRYLMLYVKEQTPSATPQAVIVTDKMSQDDLDFATQEGVRVFIT